MFKTFADWFQTSSKYAEDKNDFSHELADHNSTACGRTISLDGGQNPTNSALVSRMDSAKAQYTATADPKNSRMRVHVLIAHRHRSSHNSCIFGE